MTAPPELWKVADGWGGYLCSVLTSREAEIAKENGYVVTRYIPATPLTDAAGEMLELLREVRGYLSDEDHEMNERISAVIRRAMQGEAP